MKYFSMFSGIGGFEVGIEQTFRHMGIESTDPEPGQAESGVQLGRKWPIVEEESSVCSSEFGGRGAICIGFSEIDRYACSIYRRHFPDHKNSADIHFLQTHNRIRRLTPTECERLQGFPDGWTEYGTNEDGREIPISDTQRYKCLGNAVSTNVIARIISGWKELQELP